MAEGVNGLVFGDQPFGMQGLGDGDNENPAGRGLGNHGEQDNQHANPALGPDAAHRLIELVRRSPR